MSTLKTNTLSNVAGTASTAIENAINGSAKAWVNFNGTGTVAIRQSYNVSSITDGGTGTYTINFTNALADTNYVTVGSARLLNAATAFIPNYDLVGTTSAINTYTFTTPNGALADCTYVLVSVFR
jgi:hypothetical protein